MLRTLTLILSLSSSASLIAQVDDLPVDTVWHKGSVLLNDNSIRNGYLKMDRVSLLAAYKAAPDAEEETFLQTKIVAAELSDGDQLDPRRFARFDVATENGDHSLLCEILMEMRDFLVLSYVGLEVSTQVNTSYYNGMATGPSTVRIKGHSMSETILFASPDGGSPAETILYAPNFRRKGKPMADFWLKHRPQFYEAKALGFMHRHQTEVRQYLKEHKIKPVKAGVANEDIRAEFFELLEFYQSLEEGN